MRVKGISRRWFIGGAASFGALSGCRFLTGGADFGSGKPNLTFGVISDIHINGPVGNPWNCDETLFVSALEWFRNQGADGVVVAGDMANCGLVEELNLVGEAWRRVFPDNRAPDGRRVEKLFVTGNHDMGGIRYARLKYPKATEDEMASRMIWTDPVRAWRTAFDEDYEPIWRKTVRGYSFVGVHWVTGCDLGADETFNDDIPGFYAKQGSSFDPSRPFFHIQHPHPKNTCYGPWAWGRDVGLSTQALSRFPNAVALSGHSHYPLTDERSVWQGAFTSVGAASLRYGSQPRDEFAPEGYENSSTPEGPARADLEGAKLLPCIGTGDGPQGMLWKVYDDRIVVNRRDFGCGRPLGSDWVLPLPTVESRPFAFAERARKSVVPRFVADAKLTVKAETVKTRKGTATDVWEVAIPACVADPDARVFRYEVRATADGVTRTKRVLAEGFNRAPEHPFVRRTTLCRFARADFAAAARVAFSVTPVNCFGRAGNPLVASVEV